MKAATAIRAATFGLLALAACKCDKSIVIQPPPVVNYDGATDDSDRACAVLRAAACPAGADPGCAAALRNDQAQQQGSQVDLGCILDAGPNRVALESACHVTCR